MDVAFAYYTILLRFEDFGCLVVDEYPEENPEVLEVVDEDELEDTLRKMAKKHLSIEILRDRHLEKVHFYNDDYTDMLRPEVKQQTQWTLDRTNPTSKIDTFVEAITALQEDIEFMDAVTSGNRVLRKLIHWSYVT